MLDFKDGFSVLAAVVVSALALVGVSYFGYAIHAHFAPKYEAVRRDVMIESRAYNEATVRELYRLKRQYEAATLFAEKQTIRQAALHEFSIFPEDRLPGDLSNWFRALDFEPRMDKFRDNSKF